MSQLSDELLLAYLDGQLGTPQAQSVERMIGSSDELRARVERLKAAQGYLVQTFETLARRTRAQAPASRSSGARNARAAPAERERGAGRARANASGDATEAAPPSRSSAKMLFWGVVFSVLAAVVGYGVGKWMRVNGNPVVEKIGARVPAPANRWTDDVARLHSHFTTATVSADPESQTNLDLVQLQLSRIVNKPVQVPAFDDHDLTFRRGQVLSYRGSRMMQLSYAGADSGLIALYVMSGGPPASPSAASQGDVTTVTWSKNGLRYVLAGDLPENSLRALAAVAMSQISDQQ